mmetsp:Transcript_1175/g.3247  ORF Transcript_1175/g.3247 Transcript_1175/m.3247 type:complete len:122 (-) Transcript_1175:97-462(-)
MGALCGRPAAPPETALIGTWVIIGSDERKLDTGYGMYRVHRGFKRWIKSDGSVYAQLEIKPSGWISYVRLETNDWLHVVDMPVQSWHDGTMKIACCASLKYELSGDKRRLTIDGLELRMVR